MRLPPLRLDDDDHFATKIEIAVDAAVPLVSFAFGVPDPAAVRALRAAGSTVLITVTSADEARAALAAGPDALIAQGGSAGASRVDHPARRLPRRHGDPGRPPRGDRGGRRPGGRGGRHRQRRRCAGAARGRGARRAVRHAVPAGRGGRHPGRRSARRCSPAEYDTTVVTRAFTGQPARALRNRFTDAHSADAPVGYPAIHHLTAPIRAAAAARGDAEAPQPVGRHRPRRRPPGLDRRDPRSPPAMTKPRESSLGGPPLWPAEVVLRG